MVTYCSAAQFRSPTGRKINARPPNLEGDAHDPSFGLICAALEEDANCSEARQHPQRPSYPCGATFNFANSPPAQKSAFGFITLNHSGGIAASANMPG